MMPPFVPFPFWIFHSSDRVRTEPLSKEQVYVLLAFSLAMAILLIVGIASNYASQKRMKEEIKRIEQETQHRIDSIRTVYSSNLNS